MFLRKFLEICPQRRSQHREDGTWDPGNRALTQDKGEGNSQTVDEEELQGGSCAKELKTNQPRLEQRSE